MAYTEEQKSTIQYLINRGKAVHKSLETCEDASESEKLQSELNNIKIKLNEALNAEAMFRAHIKVAQEHLDAAQELLDRWCRPNGY